MTDVTCLRLAYDAGKKFSHGGLIVMNPMIESVKRSPKTNTSCPRKSGRLFKPNSFLELLINRFYGSQPFNKLSTSRVSIIPKPEFFSGFWVRIHWSFSCFTTIWRNSQPELVRTWPKRLQCFSSNSHSLFRLSQFITALLKGPWSQRDGIGRNNVGPKISYIP